MGISVRNPSKHGFYGLRGKVLNTMKCTSDMDIVNNKEFSEIISILGLELNDDSIFDYQPEILYEVAHNGKKYILADGDYIKGDENLYAKDFLDKKLIKDIDIVLNKYKNQNDVYKSDAILKLNYSKVAILTDADHDGNAISCQLINFFARWKEMFDGHVFRVATPLYIATKKGKSTQYFYTQDEYEANISKLKGWDIDYIKGLGSLEKIDYRETIINNPKMYNIVLDNPDYLELAFGKSTDRRKEWLLNNEI